MAESDGAATQIARISETEAKNRARNCRSLHS